MSLISVWPSSGSQICQDGQACMDSVAPKDQPAEESRSTLGNTEVHGCHALGLWYLHDASIYCEMMQLALQLAGCNVSNVPLSPALCA